MRAPVSMYFFPPIPLNCSDWMLLRKGKWFVFLAIYSCFGCIGVMCHLFRGAITCSWGQDSLCIELNLAQIQDTLCWV